ncbi:hypothetical protein [Actinomadura sp. K4S16]|uniref:hypothetical protein n=1 Tax=Actinomadura sp. K4S16 TaxID=1316147 RepID=UPI0011ECCE49|nr:hypothetical protein [Actinomadura sp. K4S16]
MARFHGSITVSALPRQWFETFVADLYEVLETARVVDGAVVTEIGEIEGVRLVKGRHLATGARYRLEGDGEADDDSTSELVVSRWSRRRETSVEFTSSDGDGTASGVLRFDSATRPRNFTMAGRYQGSGRLRQMSWKGSADIERWWEQVSEAGAKRAKPQLTARLSHSLVSLKLAIAAEPADDGRWSIDVTLVVRGRSWARPVGALASLFGGFALRRLFKRGLDDVRRGWEDNVPALVREDPLYAVGKVLIPP